MDYKSYLILAILSFLLTISSSQGHSCSCTFRHGRVSWCSDSFTAYSCDAGYEATGSWVACSGSTWISMGAFSSGSLCIPKSCRSSIPNGELSQPCSAKVGTSCSYRCNSGYRKLSTVSMIKCETSTNWSSDPHSLCSNENQCSYQLSHGDLDLSCRRQAGDTCAYRCHEGYLTSENKTVTCNKNLTWNQHLGSVCKEIICPETIDNGKIQRFCTRRYKEYCRDYTCDSGYDKPPAPSLKCNASGQWQWHKSKGKPCSRESDKCPSIIPNGKIVWHCARQPDSMCTYNCNPGCTQNRTVVWLKCGKDRQWIQETHNRCINCKPVITTTARSDLCPSTFPGGRIEYGCSRGPYDYCSFTCNAGCSKTTTALICSTNRRWIGSNSACNCSGKPVITTTARSDLCPSTFPGGRIEYGCSRGPYDYCSFTCNAGCSKTTTALICSTNRRWIDSNSACSCSEPPEYPEPTGQMSPEATAGIVVGVLVLIILVMIAVWLSFRKRQTPSSTITSPAPANYSTTAAARPHYNGNNYSVGVAPQTYPLYPNQDSQYTSLQFQPSEPSPYSQLQPPSDTNYIHQPPAHTTTGDSDLTDPPPSYEQVTSNPTEFKA